MAEPTRTLSFTNIQELRTNLVQETDELRIALNEIRRQMQEATNNGQPNQDDIATEHDLLEAIKQSEEIIADLSEVAGAYNDAVQKQRPFTQDEVKCFRYFDFSVEDGAMPMEKPDTPSPSSSGPDAEPTQPRTSQSVINGGGFMLPPLGTVRTGRSESRFDMNTEPETETDVQDLLEADNGTQALDAAGLGRYYEEHREPTPDEFLAAASPSPSQDQKEMTDHQRAHTFEHPLPRATEPKEFVINTNKDADAPPPSTFQLPLQQQQQPINPFSRSSSASSSYSRTDTRQVTEPEPQVSQWVPPVALSDMASRSMSRSTSQQANQQQSRNTFSVPRQSSSPSQPTIIDFEEEVQKRLFAERERLESEFKAKLADQIQAVKLQLEESVKDDFEGKFAVWKQDVETQRQQERDELLADHERELLQAQEAAVSSKTAIEVQELREALGAEQASNEHLTVALREARDEATLAARALASMQETEASNLQAHLRTQEIKQNARSEWINFVKEFVEGENSALRRENKDLRGVIAELRAAHEHNAVSLREEVLSMLPAPRSSTARSTEAMSIHKDSLAAAFAIAAEAEASCATDAHPVTYTNQCDTPDAIDNAVVDLLNSLGFPCTIKCRRLGPRGAYMFDQRVQLKLASGGQLMVRPRTPPNGGVASYEPLAKYLVHLYAPLLNVDGSAALIEHELPPAVATMEGSTSRAASQEQAEEIRRLQHEQRELQRMVAAQQEVLLQHQRVVADALSPSPQPQRYSSSPDAQEEYQAHSSVEPSPQPMEHHQMVDGYHPAKHADAYTLALEEDDRDVAQRRFNEQLRQGQALRMQQTNQQRRGNQVHAMKENAPTSHQKQATPRGQQASSSSTAALLQRIQQQQQQQPRDGAAFKEARNALESGGKINISQLDQEGIEQLKRAALAKQVREMKKQQTARPFR